MKQIKCLCCGEKVYEVYIDSKKEIADVSRVEIYPPQEPKYMGAFIKHTCKVPKKLQVEK